MLVTGNPGVGKTRLLEEFRATLGGRARWLGARGSPLAGNIPFGIVAEALEGELRTRTKRELLAFDDPRIADLSSIVPSLRAAGGPSPAPSLLATLEAFLALFTTLARSQLVVLALDDIHQADASTWELVSYLARNPIPAPVLVIVAVRTEPLVENADLTSTLGAALKDDLAAEVRLHPLARDDVATLTSAVLGREHASPELSDWLYGRTRGNPLFAAALLQELLEDPTRRVVPLSVVERTRAILATLPPDAREMLDLAAVVGHPFTLADVARLMLPDAAAPLDLLVGRGLLEVRLDQGIPIYDFSHPLLQEAIYDSMGAVRRRAHHERVARSLTDAPLAIRSYHAARSALPGDRDAIAIIVAAGREAGSHQRHREALGHLQKALELLPSSDGDLMQRRQLLDEIAWHASAAGDHGVGIPALQALGQLCTNEPAELATVRMRLSSFLSSGVGDLSAAEREATEAVRLLATADPKRLPAALNELAWIQGEARSLQEQIRGSRDAYARASADADPTTAMHALGSLGHALAASGAFAEGIAHLRSSRDLALASGDRDQIDWHTGTLADAVACSGSLAEAKELVADLSKESSESDVAHWAAAHVYWWSGEWRLATEACHAVGALNPRPSARSVWALSLGGLIEAYTGRATAAAFAQGERTYAGRGFYWFSAHHDWCLGAAALVRGDDHEAVTRLRRAAEQLTRIGAVGLEMHVLPDLALATLAVGDRAKGSVVAKRARSIATSCELALADALASFVEGAVAASAGERGAADALRRSARLSRELGFPLVEARARGLLAGATAGRERLDALADAARIYTRLGALHLADLTLQRLRAIGGAGRRAALGVGSLTPREREIVTLVRRGLTAREVAERLHLSERTVESHLAHSYSKLGVAGREALAALID